MSDLLNTLHAAWLLRAPLAGIAVLTTAALTADRLLANSSSSTSIREDHLS